MPARALRALPHAANDNRQPWPLRLRRAAGFLLPAAAGIVLLALMFWLS